MGGMGGGDGYGLPEMSTVRPTSQREKLQEKLRQRREAGAVNIPEVKSSGAKGTSAIAASEPEDDDDWLADVALPGAASGSSKKKGGGKKKGSKKK